MSKSKAVTAVISAHYGYNFLDTHATRQVSESERKGIKRMKKRVRNTGALTEARIIRVFTLDEAKALRVIGNLLKTH
jgi:hypothetical protein